MFLGKLWFNDTVKGRNDTIILVICKQQYLSKQKLLEGSMICNETLIDKTLFSVRTNLEKTSDNI